MSNNHIEPSDFWSGDFTWDGHFMRMHMKMVTKKYDMYNPSTWPLVYRVVATDNATDYRKSRVPPEYMVYEQSLINELDELRPLCRQKSAECGNGENMKILFHYYPLNYDRKGGLREYPHIPFDELEEWMSYCRRSKLITTEKSDAKDVVQEDKNADTCPDAAYEEIMKTLTDSESASVVSISKVEEQLSCARKELRDAKESFENTRKGLLHDVEASRIAMQKYQKQAASNIEEKVHAEKALSAQTTRVKELQTTLMFLRCSKEMLRLEYKTIRGKVERSQKDQEEMRKAMNDGESELASKNEEIKGLGSEVQKLKVRLTVATKEAEMEKQRILKIWKEMKKGKEVPSQKKKATEDISEAQRKKSKSEA